MIVRKLSPAACRSYLVGCSRTKRAAVVDPLAGQGDGLEQALEREGWKLDLIVDTHTHADHVSAGPALAAKTGAAYALHETTGCRAVTEKLKDGQHLAVGDVKLEVIHTPGHTPDSVSLRTVAEGSPPHLFTGDFLFLAQDGAGRLDLPGGDPGVHWDSLQRLASLGDDVVVLPGHDYNETDASTLGEERVRNPRFQRLSREEYVAWQRAIAMETPRWMLDVIAANLGTAAEHAAHHGVDAGAGGVGGAAADPAACATGGTCQAGPMGRVPTISVQEAAKRRAATSAPFLLDVREPHEFAFRHAPGATLLPLGHLPHRLAEIEHLADSEVLIICKSGGRSARAAEFLIACGFRRVFNIAGGTDEWARSGLPVER